ncbi:MAG: thiamine-phosphate kinase [bacterium]
MVLSELGELALIEKIRSRFKTADQRVLLSIGDDAAVFRCNDDKIAVTTDLMAEAVHFDYAFTTFYQTGFKLVASNVSDIYAMGGVPAFAFLDIALMKERTVEQFDELMLGVQDACDRFQVHVLGGDVSSSRRGDFYSATLVGFVRNPVARSGARTGDRIFVFGTLGDSAAGLAYLRRLNRKVILEREHDASVMDIEEPVIESMRRHLLPVPGNPEPFVDAIHAMIDVSDGLLIDLSRLCSESGKGAIIYQEKLPVSEGTKKIASYLQADYNEYVLSGGEDYALLFTSDSNAIPGCTCIGEIIESGHYLVDRDGTKRPFIPKGYTHFADVDTGKI